MWINKKKSKGENVSARVETASRIIGLSMKYLAESSYLNPYKKDFAANSEFYLDSLRRKLAEIKADVRSDDAAREAEEGGRSTSEGDSV